jgi:hypothetical protein
MTRESLYVAMTRGRHTNLAYVATDRPDDTHTTPHPNDNPDATARSILHGVLQHSGAELSAHEAITTQQEAATSIAQLAAEYETIAAAAQHDRWTTLIRASGLTREQADAVITSEAFGPLSAQLRRAEAHHHDIETLLPRLVAARRFDDADDIAAILHNRLHRATARPADPGRARKTSRLIVGLIPEATGPMSDDMRTALNERRTLIEARAQALLDRALADRHAWVQALGAPPANGHLLQRWKSLARTVAAYRDRYGITSRAPIGQAINTNAQKTDAARTRHALNQAKAITQPSKDERRLSNNAAPGQERPSL